VVLPRFLQKRIFEWSKTLPPWQRDLLRRLTAGPLDNTGQLEVLEILTGEPDAPAPVPLELKDLPADEGEHGCVELRAVCDLRNINCLAPERGSRSSGPASKLPSLSATGQYSWLRSRWSWRTCCSYARVQSVYSHRHLTAVLLLDLLAFTHAIVITVSRVDIFQAYAVPQHNRLPELRCCVP